MQEVSSIVSNYTYFPLRTCQFKPPPFKTEGQMRDKRINTTVEVQKTENTIIIITGRGVGEVREIYCLSGSREVLASPSGRGGQIAG